MAQPTAHHSNDPKSYRSNASFVYNAANTSPVLALLDAQPGERILDLGCGSGELTQQVVSMVHKDATQAGSVLGVDASDDMIQAAIQGAKQANLQPSSWQYQVVDGCKLTDYIKSAGLSAQFDKVFSNAAIHWMKQAPDQVVKGVYEALKPGGVFAAEFGGFMNVIGLRGACHHIVRKHGIDPDSVDPWFFPTPDAYRQLLTSPELPLPFDVLSCELVPRPTLLPNGVRGFFETFCGPFLNALPLEASRQEAMSELEEILRPDMYDPYTKTWTAMYVRLRVKAIKPSSRSSFSTSHPAAAPAAASTDPLLTSGFTVAPSQASKLAQSPTSPEAQAAVHTLETHLVNQHVLVHIPDGRVFSGVFTCVDDGMNVILYDAEEWRLHEGSAGMRPELSTEERVVERRVVGHVMIKGSDVVKVEVERNSATRTAGDADAVSQAFAQHTAAGDVRQVWDTNPDAYA